MTTRFTVTADFEMDAESAPDAERAVDALITNAIYGSGDEFEYLGCAVVEQGFIARFTPQAWINNYAVDVDAEGETEWDATEGVAGTPPRGWPGCPMTTARCC